MSVFAITVTKETNGLLRLPVFVSDTSNPKDPPVVLALLDGGANCNLISNSRARSIQLVPTLEDGKITFANDSRSTITHSLLLNVTAKYQDIKFTFQAKFFICPCSEDLILGRSTLNATGLIHLYITDDVAPNPFKPTASVSNVVIDIVDDQSGELDDAIVPHPEPAFHDSTPNLWIPYCSSLGIPYEIFFDLIDWFARHT